MNVENTHSLYQDNLESWALVRDSVDGEKAIKSKAQTYLIKPSGHNEEQYNNYLARAHYTGFTTRTLEGLYGQIFSREPEKLGDVPESFQNFLENVDLTGNSIDQFSSDLVYDLLQTGWGGILIDHAPVPKGLSLADQEKAGLTSFMRWYKAEDVINWRYDVINNKKVLALVVLQESYEEANDEDLFVPLAKTRYRVLRLVDGVYVQELYLKVENATTKKAEYVLQETPDIKMNGKPLDFIPFFPCPAREPEKSMLLPIAYVNLAHYQKSADYTNYTHFAGILTAYAAGINIPMKRDDKGYPTNIPDTIKLGLDAFLFLESSKDSTSAPVIGYLEPTGQGGAVLIKAIEDLKLDIEKMGGDLITAKKKGVETAEAARIHQAGENAVLGSFSLNMSEKITQAIRLCAKWRGVPEAIAGSFTYQLNLDYEGDLSKEGAIAQGRLLFESDAISHRTFLTDYMGFNENEADEELKLINDEKPDIV